MKGRQGQRPHQVQAQRLHRTLLTDIRVRGGTSAAIDEAYVNALGGLTLDVPSSLEEIERQTAEGDSTQQVALWRTAITRARQDGAVSPEIAGAIASQLWEALYFAPGVHGCPETQRPQDHVASGPLSCSDNRAAPIRAGAPRLLHGGRHELQALSLPLVLTTTLVRPILPPVHDAQSEGRIHRSAQSEILGPTRRGVPGTRTAPSAGPSVRTLVHVGGNPRSWQFLLSTENTLRPALCCGQARSAG
jgi:hypothetical protein